MQAVMPIRFGVSLVFAAALVGCASRQPKPSLPPSADAEYKPYSVPGTANVSGSSYLLTRSGDVKRGAARQVHLIPETSFVSPLVSQDDTYYATFDLMVEKYTTDSIAQVWVHTRTTVADVEGKFTFNNVPAGRYIVETKLFWQYVSCGFFGCGVSDTGAVLRKRIEVKEGQQVDAQLTSVITR